VVWNLHVPGNRRRYDVVTDKTITVFQPKLVLSTTECTSITLRVTEFSKPQKHINTADDVADRHS
jgi:hypothetical protein